MQIMSYHVFSTREGGRWLADDEHSWTPFFHDAAAFTSATLARDIGERETDEDETFYVMACM